MSKPFTDADLTAKFLSIMDPIRGDIEGAHCVADTFICDVLKDLGFPNLIAAYEEVDKWYA